MDKPKKEIPILIKFKEFSFFINGTLVPENIYNKENSKTFISNIPENIYNKENSKTFISNNKSKFSYSDILANIGYKTIESFYFKNTKNNIIKYDNIGFILAINIIRDNNCVLV